MKIYLAGPMTRYPKFNYPAFYKAADRLRADGHVVFNPAEHDVELYGPGFYDLAMASETGVLTAEEIKRTGFSKRQVLKDDTAWICEHAEAIAFLPGWRKGRGARAEMALARALGLWVLFL